MSDSNSGNTTAKAFGGIMLIVALVGGMSSIFLPMQNRISDLNQRLEKQEQLLREHEKTNGHPDAISKINHLRELIEAQTKRDTERLDKLEEWGEKHVLRVAPLNAAQWERIRSNEQWIEFLAEKLGEKLPEREDK